MTPFTLFVAIFACLAAVYAAALPNATLTDIADLEKRVDHSGKVGHCGRRLYQFVL